MAIKSYDADCGGDSEFVVLKKNGSMSAVRHLDIAKGERYSRIFDEAVRLLYFTYADPRASDAYLAAQMHAFQTNLKSARRFAKEVQKLTEQLDAMPNQSAAQKSEPKP
jgi:hypothetical protein